MSLKAHYTASPGVVDREIEITLPMAPQDDDRLSEWRLETAYREVTITLAFGQFWPPRLRKGVPIEYDIMGHRFVGVVKRRRRHVLVCGGEFVS